MCPKSPGFLNYLLIIYNPTIVQSKRGKVYSISSIIESRPLQVGFSEADAEMEFGVQDLIRGSAPVSRKARVQGWTEGKINCRPCGPWARPGAQSEDCPRELSHAGPHSGPFASLPYSVTGKGTPWARLPQQRLALSWHLEAACCPSLKAVSGRQLIFMSTTQAFNQHASSPSLKPSSFLPFLHLFSQLSAPLAPPQEGLSSPAALPACAPGRSLHMMHTPAAPPHSSI